MERQLLKQLNLLLVDDNCRIHAELYELLAPLFKTITFAHDAVTAWKRLHELPIDLIISDIHMPGEDGLSFIERVRTENLILPIIVLSAHADSHYLFRAANLQIDGYIIKPINFRKLDAALARAIKRIGNRFVAIQITPNVIYEPKFKSLSVDGDEVSLGSKECQLLELLLSHCDRVVSKEEILRHVWAGGSASESALKNLLSELRRKLKYPVIHNHSGRGWHLSLEES